MSFFRNSLLASVSAALLSSAAWSQSLTTVQARRVTSFIASIGVNTHLGFEDTAYSVPHSAASVRPPGYPVANDGALTFISSTTGTQVTVNVWQIQNALKLTGISFIRDNFNTDSYNGWTTADRFQGLITYLPYLYGDFTTSTFATASSPGRPPTYNVSIANSFVHNVASFEGLNEATDSPGPPYIVNQNTKYEGLVGSAADCRWQVELLNAVQNWNSANHLFLPVIAPSSGVPGGETTIASCATSSTAANAHVYANGGQPTPSFANNLPSKLQDASNGSPLYITETGTATNVYEYSSRDELTAAKLSLEALLSAYSFDYGPNANSTYHQSVVNQTYFYELIDQFPTSAVGLQCPSGGYQECHFGLFHYDWTPKAAALALQAQGILLADGGANQFNFAPGSLSYSVGTGAPPQTHTALLQKSSGAFVLAVWAEPAATWNAGTNGNPGTPIATPTTAVQLNFGRSFSKLQSGDPFKSPTSWNTLATNTSSVSIPVSDHPIYVQLTP